MITGITYNFCTGNSFSEKATVGVDGVKVITGHASQGEGDRWFYDIEYEDGKSLRVFNPDVVTTTL